MATREYHEHFLAMVGLIPTDYDGLLGNDRAKARLNRCLEEGDVRYSRHFREELADDNLGMEDVLTICRSGAIIMAAEKDLKNGR